MDMPHPDPPLKGREFSSCAIIAIIAIIAIAIAIAIAIMQLPRVMQRIVIPAQAGIHILGGR
ncbi:hypothetical protein [Sphingomonas sp. PP-CE-3A-406]|uniref:hypothetical protein n=1 Tax=Sphingomonas sp. PP-CE-3A-406 TaxID=2135659 RepID=UPI0016050BEC|nr:hypothetical protein [Sphingomonas sp. PP-CE-3A-406]